jgi:hypothetical protein
MTKAIRQGDVLVVPCDSIPGSATTAHPENGRLIVARGEATGHHHSFPWARGATLFRDDGAGSGGAQFVDVMETVALEHQEHSALTVTPGKYQVVIQRTMSSGLVRRVED